MHARSSADFKRMTAPSTAFYAPGFHLARYRCLFFFVEITNISPTASEVEMFGELKRLLLTR
jgi:hypothetical protein